MDVRKLNEPENGERVETGAVQFGNDWPGVFIRGDQCVHLCGLLTGAKKTIGYGKVLVEPYIVDELIEILKAGIVKKAGEE